MMMFILLIVSLFLLANGQENAELRYLETCFSEGTSLTLEAVYTGSGTPSLVQWSYSGGTGTNLMVKNSDCTVLGSVPAGYPDAARMEYKCPTTDSLPANTYRLTITGLTSDELTDSWGATFTPPTGSIPVAVKVAIPVCTATTTPDCPWWKPWCWPWWKIVVIIIICILVLILIGVILGCFLIKTTCCCDCFYQSESCEDCGNYKYCRCECCAPTPCGACCNIEGLPPWYQRLWASIIGSPVALGILLVWNCCGQANPIGGHAHPDHAQPLQDRPVNFN